MEYKQPPAPPGPPPSAPPPYTANYGPAPTPVCKSISNQYSFKVKICFSTMIFGFKSLL